MSTALDGECRGFESFHGASARPAPACAGSDKRVLPYLLQPLNLIDVVSICPFYIELLLACGSRATRAAPGSGTRAVTVRHPHCLVERPTPCSSHSQLACSIVSECHGHKATS